MMSIKDSSKRSGFIARRRNDLRVNHRYNVEEEEEVDMKNSDSTQMLKTRQ